MRRINTLYWTTLRRVDRSINESIEYSLPQLPILGLVGVVGFPVFYWIWHDVFPQPYDNVAINIIGCLLAAGFIKSYGPNVKQTPKRKLFWIFVVTFDLSFFFTFMLLKNNCNMVWTMSTMAGLTLLVLIAYDWLLATLIHIVGSLVAFLLYMLTTSAPIALELYAIQIPIYFFVVIAGGLFNYQSATFHQARLKALASVGASLAHELRTPLLSIDYQSKRIDQVLRKQAHNNEEWIGNEFSDLAELNESVHVAQREIKHANTIIDMFLLDLGSKNIYERRFSYHSASSVVGNAIDRYPFASQLERSKVSYSVDEDFKFYGSDLLLMHVIFNLIKNALAHLDLEGDVHISLKTRKKGNLIEVSDSGCGIAANNVPYIFDEFYTSESPMGRSGTGIGLAFCKKVMLHFNGKIECQSELGRYTVFRLTFPSVPNEDSVGQELVVDKLLDELKGLKILALERPHGQLQKLHAKLPRGFDLTCVHDLASAFFQLKTSAFDTIVFDTDIKVKSLLDVVIDIRTGEYFTDNQCENYKNIPIVLISGSSIDAKTEAALLELGASVCCQEGASLETELYLTVLSECLNSAKLRSLNIAKWQRLRGKLVLVVDDHEINYQHVRAQLEPYQIDVLYAADGVCAIQLLESRAFDFIVMDLHMPSANGWQVTEKIRSGVDFTNFKQYGSIPIIGLTGDPRSELLTRCLQSGFNTLIYKPVEQSKLLDTLVEQMDSPIMPDGAAASQASSSGALPAEYLEPEAQFLHDILTPLLVIENGTSVLKETISTLLEAHSKKSPFESRAENQLAIVQVASEVETLTGLIRSKIKVFWREARAIANPRELSQLQEKFVLETENLWNGIEETLSTVEERGLPSYLNEVQEQFGNAPALEEATLERLYSVNEKFYQEIKTGRELIRIYSNARNVGH